MNKLDYRKMADELWTSIEVIDAALDERDQYTRNHSRRLLTLASKTGEQCALSVEDIKLLKIAANMHDIGKIGIPDSVLLKPSKLDAEEWEIMKSHSTKGERIIRIIQNEHVPKVADIIRHHHEQFNGKGYPDGQTGEDILFCSRIISVCDSYDAMTTTRIYSRSRTHDEALAILHEEEGEKSDPYIFRNFLRIVGNGEQFVQ